MQERDELFDRMRKLETLFLEEHKRAKEDRDNSNTIAAALATVQETSILRQTRFISKMEKDIELHDIIEMHEALDVCVRAYNDLVFDTGRPPRTPSEAVMTESTKELLKNSRLSYITQLFKPPQDIELEADVDTARKESLDILTKEEQQLCKILIKKLKEGRAVRNARQHPPPDRATALDRIRAIDIGDANLRLLEAFLTTDPRRIPIPHESRDDPDLLLFAPDRTYFSVAAHRDELAAMKVEKEMDEATKIVFEHAKVTAGPSSNQV